MSYRYPRLTHSLASKLRRPVSWEVDILNSHPSLNIHLTLVGMAFIGHSDLFQGWSLEVVTQYQYSSTFTSFNTREGGNHEGRQGPSCDLMIHEVIFTGSTDKDLQLVKVSQLQF